MSSKIVRNIEYVAKSQIHFGNLKYSIPKGAVVKYVQSEDKSWIQISDEKIDQLKDFKIALKVGLFQKLGSTDKKQNNVVLEVQEKKQKKIQRLPVVKSDMDEMEEVIDISHTKNLYDKKYNSSKEKQEEVEGQNIRGLKVIRDTTSQLVEQNGIKMSVKTVGDSNKQMLQQVNGKNLKKIAIKKDKKGLEQKAQKIAQKRKKQSLQNQKKMKKENKK